MQRWGDEIVYFLGGLGLSIPANGHTSMGGTLPSREEELTLDKAALPSRREISFIEAAVAVSESFHATADLISGEGARGFCGN